MRSLNLHSAKGMLVDFFCDMMLPNAQSACKQESVIQASTNQIRVDNPSSTLNCDILAVQAGNKELFDIDKINRLVRSSHGDGVFSRTSQVLGHGPNNFLQACPSEAEASTSSVSYLKRSLATERELCQQQTCQQQTTTKKTTTKQAYIQQTQCVREATGSVREATPRGLEPITS
jgi:hypothetical protein